MKPFEIVWTEAQITDLKQRLGAYVLPASPQGVGWDLGCDPEFLDKFRNFWINGYDWRGALASLNKYPQFIAEIEDVSIHFVQVKGEGASPRPLLLSHGWPGSVYEFWGIIERLAYPSRFGGRAEDAFELIIPSLPGFGYSGKPAQPIGPRQIAGMWNTLMTETLGHRRYLAQGGDWGGAVTSQLGILYGKNVHAIHLNMVGVMSSAPPQNEAEEAWMQKWGAATQQYSGYNAVQMAKPLSLAWLAAGNPMGQAAWIIERFHDWADLRDSNLETVFGLGHLVTSVMLYIMPESFASSMWIYNGYGRDTPLDVPTGQRCETPTGFLACPGDALMPAPPKSRMELTYNLVHWSELKTGGHFAAMEQPVAIALDIQNWAAKVWPGA